MWASAPLGECGDTRPSSPVMGIAISNQRDVGRELRRLRRLELRRQPRARAYPRTMPSQGTHALTVVAWCVPRQPPIVITHRITAGTIRWISPRWAEPSPLWVARLPTGPRLFYALCLSHVRTALKQAALVGLSARSGRTQGGGTDGLCTTPTQRPSCERNSDDQREAIEEIVDVVRYPNQLKSLDAGRK